MNNLYVLVGLPASGKSTWAMEQCNKNQNLVWLSSDKLREELYNNVNDMEHNNETFEEMRKRAKKALNKGMDVIYDATNISSKRRKALLDQFIGIQKICIYFAEDLDEIYFRNITRRRVVPEEVLNKMYKSLQVPMWHEGWDDIHVIRDEYRSKDFMANIKYYMDNMNQFNYEMILDSREEFKDNLNLGQDNPYHTLSISRHMYYAYKLLKDKTEDENLLIAALLHDIGKAYCKQFKDNSKYANFIGHENVSAQLAFNYLIDCGYGAVKALDIATLIQLHMRLMNIKDNIKAKEKLINNIGKLTYERLEALYNADIQAK